MHDRGAEAAHEPRSERRVRRNPEVEEVLHQREARARREAEDRGVDEESDAVHANQSDDDERLQRLLDDRSRIARVSLKTDRQAREQESVQEIRGERARHAAADDREHHAQPHELVAVEDDERAEKDGDGGESEQRGTYEAGGHAARLQDGDASRR